MKVGPKAIDTVIQVRAAQLRDPAHIRMMRNKFLHAFQKFAGIKDLSRQGMRMVIDVDGNVATMHFMAGLGTPNPCPHDWKAEKETKWDPQAPNFFVRVALEAKKGQKALANGTKLFYPDADTEVFGVESGDPKTDIHFLMLSIEPFATMVHEGFSERLWLKFFEGAYQILRTLGVEGMPTRYVANFGMGFQATARVHMHVHVQIPPNELPGLNPKDYGLEVNDDGSVRAPANASADQKRLVELADKWKNIKGFGPAQDEEKRNINKELHPLMKKLRIR